MSKPPSQPDPKFFPILKQYADGDISASKAADQIYDLKIPGYEDPAPGDVVAWSKLAGFGTPSPSADDAKAEADNYLKKRGES